MLVYELQAHPQDLGHVHQVGIIEKLKYLSYAFRVCMSCLLHESLSSFSKLFLGTEHLILVSSLNEGNYIFCINLNIASIDELEEALQYFRLDVRDRDLSLGPLHKWSVEHLLKDIGASREYLAVCKYSLGTRMLSRNNDNICKILTEHNLLQIPSHYTRIVHLVPELGSV